MRDDSAGILFQSFLQEALVISSDMGRVVLTLMLSIQRILCDHGVAHPPRYPEGWFWRGVVACDMPELCKFPSLDSCQKRLLWTHKGVDASPQPVVGLVVQVGDAEKFSQALTSEGLDPSLIFSKQGSCFTAIEEDGGEKRLGKLELACEADGVASTDVI